MCLSLLRSNPDLAIHFLQISHMRTYIRSRTDSKQRVHSTGGYYFLLAAAVGMIRPIDVEPLTRDTLVLLETDYPTPCDAAPPQLIQDPAEWTLVDNFCFFSGGPINTEEDVYYQADFDGNPIYMLAFLSPSLTPEELYKLSLDNTDEPGLKSAMQVAEVESVYDLTERDFDDLKLYHLGPCRALYVSCCHCYCRYYFNTHAPVYSHLYLSLCCSTVHHTFSSLRRGPRYCHHTFWLPSIVL
jgi:hypothetical protein